MTDTLPPLPEPYHHEAGPTDYLGRRLVYTAQDMRSYAAEAVRLAVQTPMSDEQARAIYQQATGQTLPNMGRSIRDLIALVRAVEAHHGIKEADHE